MLRKIIAIISALVLSATLFAGCSDKPAGNSSDINVQSTSGDNLPKLDIKSDTVKWLCWNSAEDLEDETTSLGLVNKLMKVKYGCHLEIVRTTYEELTQKAVQLILSGDAPDIVFFKMADFPNFILNSLVQDVTQYIDTSDPFWSYMDENPLKYQGVNYNCYVRTATNGATYFNTKMFKNAGLETPYELFKKNEWTWEKMFEVAKKLTQDTNGDGTVDVYGGNINPLYLYPTCGDDFVTINEDGTYSNNIRSNKIANVMNYMYNLSQSGYIGGDVWEGTSAFLVDEQWQITVYSDKLADGTIGIAPSPRMSAEEDWYVNGGYSGEWLSKGAKNPGGAMAFAAINRWLLETDEGKKINEDFEKANYSFNAEVQEVREWLKNPANTKQNLVRATGVGNFGQQSIFSMFNDTCQWGVPWSTNVESTYPILQTQIDTINVKLATADDY